MSNIGLYTKAILGALTAGAIAAITALGDGHITNVEWTTIIGGTLLSLGAVWGIPNMPASVAKYGKAITGALAAGVAALATAYVSGNVIHTTDWINVAIAVFGALGIVSVAPNAAQSDITYDDGGEIARGSDIEYEEDELDEDEVPSEDIEPDSDVEEQDSGELAPAEARA